MEDMPEANKQPVRDDIRYVPIASELLIQPGNLEQEVSLRELWKTLLSGKWIIMSITMLFSIIAIVASLMMPNVYKAEALLAPVTDEQQSGLGALAGQFGGLASFAGINIGGSTADKTVVAIEVMKSHQFIAEFISSHDLLVPIMAVEDWDLQSNTLVYNEGVYDKSQDKWVRDVKPPRAEEPSLQEAYEKFIKHLLVEQNQENGLVSVSIEHYSPYLAKQWVDWLVGDINENMKQRDSKEAIRSIEYLNNEIANTNVAELRNVLFQLVEEQTKTLMLANVRDEYVFKTLDPALVQELKAKPNRVLISVLGLVLGVMLGTILVLVLRLDRGGK